jgi:replicative DNA helicase
MVTEIELFQFRPNSVRLLFVGLDEERSYKRKEDIREETSARISDAAARIKKMKINSDEKHAIFVHELQSTLRMVVGFSNIYFELSRICYLYATNLLFKH